MSDRKKIGKQDIGKLLSEWNQQFSVSVPSRDNGQSMWAKWDGSDVSFLDWYRNTVVPAKSNFLPSMEEMFRFEKGSEGYKIEIPAPDDQKQLIFGIRPCDARALTIIDAVFKDGYEDPYYFSKRNNSILVGLGCTNPCDSCFCTSLGINPGESSDVDLMLTDIGDQFLIEGISQAGKELIAATNGLEDAVEADDNKAKETKETSYAKVTKQVNVEDVQQRLLSCFEDEEHWTRVAAKCISCGVCTLLCPTCHCFDINDELNKNQGARYRSLDSCSFCVYTKMPMENPREAKWRRVRQKVAHKYEFYPMNFDVIACTGCGRCIRMCPVNWDITQTLEGLPAKT